MGLLRKLAGVLLFFWLFAFALNNQHEAVVNFIFGMQWQGPMIFVVLVAFACGCAFGVLMIGLRKLFGAGPDKAAPLAASPAPAAAAAASAEAAPAPRESL